MYLAVQGSLFSGISQANCTKTPRKIRIQVVE